MTYEESIATDISYMDCWHFVAPLIPVTDERSREMYVMIFGALKMAEKQHPAETVKQMKQAGYKVKEYK